MIHGHKPSAYFVTSDGDGRKFEGECRQCIHCLYTWEYHPGSGTERGYCLLCGGFLCARPQCILEQKRMVDQFLFETGKTRTCIPFHEWNERLRDKLAKHLPLDPALTITPSGVIVPREVPPDMVTGGSRS